MTTGHKQTANDVNLKDVSDFLYVLSDDSPMH